MIKTFVFINGIVVDYESNLYLNIRSLNISEILSNL